MVTDALGSSPFCCAFCCAMKLANLNDQDRATLRALVDVGWDEVDAAEMLGIPPATLRSRLHRARIRAACKTTADLAFAYGLERAA